MFDEKKIAKKDHVEIFVKLKGEDTFGQSGIQGWTYKEIWEDTWEHQIPKEIKDLIDDVEIKEL